MSKVGRNMSCPCGSGKKYKNCCGGSAAGSSQGFDATQLFSQAVAHFQGGRLNHAAAICEQILVHQPNHADALHISGHICDRLGDFEKALARLGQAIHLAPRNPAYVNSMGVALGQRGRYGDAEASFRKAIELRPDYLPSLGNLAKLFAQKGNLDEAEDCYRRALEIDPGSADLLSNCAALLQSRCQFEEAGRMLDRALERYPSHRKAHAARIMNALYDPGRRAGDVRAAALEFARSQEGRYPPRLQSHRNSPDPERRIRVGYVSSDLRRHSVAYFIEPILAHHDRSTVEVYCYSTGAHEDDVTRRLKSYSDCWVAAGGLSDDGLAERVISDRIDILIDLSGHTSGNRLLMFARKPAPVQLTWFGFLATTGLDAIDYRFTDEIVDPPLCADADVEYVERLWRLPRSCLVYRPPLVSPELTPPPSARKGFVTFASFNQSIKHNDEVIRLWSDILCTVEGSRLLLKGLGVDKGRLRNAYESKFAKWAVDAGRLELQPYDESEVEYLRRYEDVDIALDPFPHNGVTTTCAALWMGVPVVTTSGDRHAGRMCASVLTNAGLSRLVARSRQEYLSIATTLASDPQALSSLRATLRDRLRSSSLMDEVGVTRDIEAAFRAMWSRWCASQSPT